ncbi:MAG: efflux RND transporter permease subunit [Candidatus Aceula meridiana]|nr:efflux RND transporter permease subunit [Candidatus Aceula meridiana]
MKLAELSVKNSLLINLLSFFIIFAGIFSMMSLQRDAFPLVDLDVLTITTYYPGAPAEDVEKLVTIPIEKEIKGLSGIKQMNSSSEEGLSSIGITIDPQASDKRQVVDDIKRAVDRVSNLPAEIKDDPYVYELRSKDRPVIEISLSGDILEKQRRQYAESLEDQILDIKGVASISRIGWRDPEFWVEVDPVKLNEYHISLQEIMTALNRRNVTLPGGLLTTDDVEYNIRVTGDFKTADQIAEVIIRANDMGNHLCVKDVSKVYDTFEDETRIALINGQRALGMVVVKSEAADVIRVVSRVRKVVESFQKTLPDNVKITITNDFSYYVQRRLNVLRNNGMLGFALVLLVLFLFLDPIPAVMTALGIPIALFSTFIVMNILGISINLVSMLGLIIVLGMLVDDGIIVSENVYRYVEGGMPAREAAIRGTSEVIAPVTATILTTIAAFAPLMFMKDIMGKFIKQIPIVVMVALVASLLEAFIILPAHLSGLLEKFKHHNSHQNKEGIVKKKEKKWFKNLVAFYTRILNGALDRRYIVLTGLVITFIVVCMSAAMYMKIILFSGEGIEYFYVRAEAVQGTPLEKMNELLNPVEKLIGTLPKGEVDSYRTYIGSIEREGGWDENAKRGTHLAQITVFLTPMQERKRNPGQIVESLRPQLEKIQGFKKLYFYLAKEGPPTGRSVQVGIKGDDFSVSQKVADDFIKYLQGMEGISDADTSYQYGKKQLRIVVDEQKARQYYLDVSSIADTVRAVFKGGLATTVRPEKAEDEINVLVRFPDNDRRSFETFDKILVSNSKGALVPLKAVAQVVQEEGIYVISHLDGKRVIWVVASADGKKASSLSANLALQKQFKNVERDHLGYTVKYSGEYEDQQESTRNLMRSFLFAFFFIFIILTAIFKSLIQPFVVMLAIPFGLLGVIIAFFIHGRPLSFFALMGLVGLTGIVVNNAIVLVDFVNKLRKSGQPRRESLVQAGQIRLRPVLMTSITTIMGLVSVAYGIGGGDPFLKPMALAIIWGLFFATGLTLIIIPCIYAIIDDISEKILHHSTIRENGMPKA